MTGFLVVSLIFIGDGSLIDVSRDSAVNLDAHLSNAEQVSEVVYVVCVHR